MADKPCDRKVIRGDSKKITRALGRMRKKWSDPGLTAYKCPFCSKWHIGHLRIKEGCDD